MILSFIQQQYPGYLKKRYNINEKKEPMEMLTEIAVNRNAIKTKGEADLLKASNIILDEFRSGKIGRISLENPKQ